MIVLIPAYEPGDALPLLVSELLDADPDVEIVVVDDGSGARFAGVFDGVRALGATVLAHETNLGKGAALKTGFAHAMRSHPADDIVTADADGQHTVADIVAVADEMRRDAAAGSPAMVLGCRAFAGRVPLRSRVGNAAARGVFRLAAGWRLSDTQTGLRGIPSLMLPWLLEQPGERFEYEQNVLLRARRDGWSTREVPIETVYLGQNASSHFRPVADSARVMLPLLAFAGSSMIAFVVDTVALLLFTALTGWLVPSIVAARVLSASVNFAVNRRFVFRQRVRRDLVRQALRYAILAAALLASNVVWMTALTDFGVPLLLAKVATEAVLFVTSYGVQKSFVFASQDVTAPQTTQRSRIAADGRVES
ncbi:glycosyltransferase family 2 protein [Microbacterium sp. SS28]|uniref:GtrA family protein n=1 Tax=Microbacterium sp. SS28 TaxID=2919948 RepID=UPI001FA9527C|nr:glycosyltransferase family 2 protein [Microbacterium sp. SS28]